MQRKRFSDFASKMSAVCPINQAIQKACNTVLPHLQVLSSAVEWLPVVASSFSAVQCQQCHLTPMKGRYKP